MIYGSNVTVFCIRKTQQQRLLHICFHDLSYGCMPVFWTCVDVRSEVIIEHLQGYRTLLHQWVCLLNLVDGHCNTFDIFYSWLLYVFVMWQSPQPCTHMNTLVNGYQTPYPLATLAFPLLFLLQAADVNGCHLAMELSNPPNCQVISVPQTADLCSGSCNPHLYRPF